MKSAEVGPSPSAVQAPQEPRSRNLAPYRPFGAACALLLVVFAWPLYLLVRLSLASELNSHVALMPFASAYLVWLQRASLPAPTAPDRKTAAAFGLPGLLLFVGYGASVLQVFPLAAEDRLALAIGSFVLGLGAVAAWTLGRPLLRFLAFPLGVLLFMIPLPSGLTHVIETGLQHGSAAVAFEIFRLSGMPVYRDATFFMLPGFSMEVAPECSGIRSTLALFITSTFAGYLFLRSWWRRTLLVLAVIPLALLRNGFRVWVIGELCVRISPDMIHSFIHRQGGPIFFALSLVPFGGLLWLLVRSERRRPAATVA